MARQPYFDWNPKDGVATCILFDGNQVYFGLAQCHVDDKDMMTEKVGCEIALRRAEIQALQGYKNNVLRPGLAALEQLYYSANRNKKYNRDGYAERMIYRQIQIKKNDIKVVKEEIQRSKDSLKKYIDNKEAFYQKIRANRKRLAAMEQA